MYKVRALGIVGPDQTSLVACRAAGLLPGLPFTSGAMVDAREWRAYLLRARYFTTIATCRQTIT